MRAAPFGLALLLLGCGPTPAPMAALPARTQPSAPARASVPAPVPEAPPTVAEPVSAATMPPSRAEAPEPTPPSPPAPVLLEPAYSALGHARLATEMLTLARDEELFQWALGGSADPTHPSNLPGYHPATRVVVDVELLSRAPKGSTKRLQRIARSSGYWGFRACFEDAERIAPKRERSAKVRLTLSAAGRVLGSRSIGPTPERDYARCVLERARRLDFTPGFTRKLDVEISVKQWPGHAPVPPRAPEGAPVPQLDASGRATLAQLTPLWAACYQRGLAVDPKLWGRLAFKLTLGPDGAPERAVEVETRFPNAEVVECARQALLGARLGANSTSELTLALRFGQPPPPSPPEPAIGVEPAPPAPAPPAPAPPPPVSVHSL